MFKCFVLSLKPNYCLEFKNSGRSSRSGSFLCQLSLQKKRCKHVIVLRIRHCTENIVFLFLKSVHSVLATDCVLEDRAVAPCLAAGCCCVLKVTVNVFEQNNELIYSISTCLFRLTATRIQFFSTLKKEGNKGKRIHSFTNSG